MSQTLDERAREASEALRAAAELRPKAATLPRTRATLRVVVTAALVVVAVSVGAVIAFHGSSTRPLGSADRPQSAKLAADQYKASAVLLANGKRSEAELRRDARLLTFGVVPRRAAVALQEVGDPARLAAQIHTMIDAKIGTITITSIQPTSARANSVVNAFGEQLIKYLNDVAKGLFNMQVAAALQHQTTLERSLRPLLDQLHHPVVGRDDTILKLKAESLQHQFRKAANTYQVLLRPGGSGESRYRLIESTDAIPLAPMSVEHSKPLTRNTVIVIALLAGLVLGAMLALLLGRFAPRLRARRNAA